MENADQHQTLFGDLRDRLGAAMSVEDFDDGAEFRQLARRHPQIGCRLEKLRYPRWPIDFWELSDLFSLSRGVGHGSRFLRDLAALVEERQSLIAIRVGPTPFGDPSIGVERLVDFYERHGFIRGCGQTPRRSRMCLVASGLDPAIVNLIMTGFGGADIWNRGLFLDRLAARRAVAPVPGGAG